MDRSRICVLGSLVFVSMSSFAAQFNPIVMFPSGGETFVVGQTQFVRVQNIAPKYKLMDIQISTDGGTTYTEVATINNLINKNEQFFTSFIVPNTPSTNCVLRVHPTGAQFGVIDTVSGPFSIVAAGSNGSGSSAPSGPAGGDLTGTYPNPTIATKAVTAPKIGSGQASSGMVLTADGNGGASWQTPQSSGSGGTHTYSVPYVEFNASSGANFSKDNDYVYVESGRTALAGVHLPDGATITGMSATVNAQGNTGNTVTLASNGGNIVTVQSVNTNFTAESDTGTANQAVNNSANAYFLKAQSTNGFYLYRVFITYTLP